MSHKHARDMYGDPISEEMMLVECDEVDCEETPYVDPTSLRDLSVASITSTTGVRFNVRILRDGDRYGLNDCLVVGSEASVKLEGHGPFVEFYDSRYPHTPIGQFVSRYGVDTILGTDGYGTGRGGLDLMGYVPAWKIDAAAMAVVRTWLAHEIGA